MNKIRQPAIIALAAVLTVAACATPNRPQIVTDPYANAGGGAIYQGDLQGGALGGNASAEYFRTTVGDTVIFPAEQTSLTAEARTTLTRQAAWLKEHTGFTASVEGHADEKGTREYNLALGARRANSVQEYLIAQGVEASRIRTNTYGKERPLEICSTELCFAQNRRAQTVVSQGAGT
ncbi:peptidoglycan-associated lipoprotein Pal [Paracoccus sp. M683]|uniref:peptidoglycan-associated lipoprotein Pal n=1 Tax=Paracoccus sp. M683 TaxID=2594268 RepID=UPI00117EE034|nr:peptidoglycan-associated lipoprotein Pal [Paracoccus sp. M683]TRW97520.1 peptidoglycan-associated lipoprotein Pal [Paracoccus sp. M683]